MKKFKRLAAVLLALCIFATMLPTVAFAEEQARTELIEATASQISDDEKWSFAPCGEGVELTAYHGTATDVYVPFKVTYNDEDYAVLKLAENLFADNDSLNSVTLGAGILEIGAKSFYDCDNLVCIVTNESLTTIGAEAFYSCDSFNSVILYDAISTIGENAFAQCPSLTIWCNEFSVAYTYVLSHNIDCEIMNYSTIPQTVVQDGVKYYISNGMARVMHVETQQCVVIPASLNRFPVTEISENALSAWYSGEIFIPNSITIIPENLVISHKVVIHCGEGSAFHSFATGHYIPVIITNPAFVPEKVTENDFIFYTYQEGFAALHSYNGTDSTVVVPESVNGYKVTKVLPKAFNNVRSVVSVSLPDSIDYIYSNAFYSCYSLESVNIPCDVTIISPKAFEYCYDLSNIKLHDGITRFEGSAFQNTGLKEIKFPASLNYIGSSVFAGSGITEINYPFGVELADEAFSCRKIVVSEKDKSIDFDAFSKKSITSVDSPIFYVYTNSVAHQNCVEAGARYHLMDGLSPEPYEFIHSIDWNNETSYVTYMVYSDYAALVDAQNVLAAEYLVLESVDGVPVTTVMDGAFKDCRSIQSITIPESVRFIGERAFENCESLTTVNVPDDITVIKKYALAGCTSLKSLQLSSKLEIIEEHAFSDCGIEQVVFPDSLQKIGNWAFGGSNLKTLDYPNIEIGDFAFADCDQLETVTVEYGTTVMAYRVFQDCENLLIVNMPETVKEFRDRAFPLCPKVIVISKSADSPAIQHAKEHGRMYCVEWSAKWIRTAEVTQDGIKYLLVDNMWNRYRYSAIVLSCDESVSGHIVLPDIITLDGYSYQVARIGVSAFADNRITEVDIPESVHVIDDLAFQCASITKFTMPDNLDYVGVNLFNASKITEFTLPINYDMNYGDLASISTLRRVIIPEGVKVIPERFLQYNRNIEQIILPESLKRIETLAFDSISGVFTELIVPGNVSIDEYAFRSLTGLKKLIISEGMTHLEDNFDGCSNLELVYLPASLTYIDYEAFERCPKAVFCVYENSYAHEYAHKRGLPYFVLRKSENPEISFGAGIGGNVTYLDGSAATGATVEIFYDDGVLKESVVTDENGAYEFTYAEVGDYTIRVTDTSGNTASTAISVKRMNAFDVFLSGDTNLRLKKSWTVSGSVNSNAATVTIADSDGNVLSSTETTDGSFSFSNIPNGTYIITATTETGSVSQEITVFDGNVSDIQLTIAATSATLWGYVEVEDRKQDHHRRNWVEVTVYNAEGIAVSQGKTDKDGKYTFTGLPVGEYAIVAETAEMRPDKKHGYDRSHTLTGYAYIDITEAGTYQVETIVLREENDHQTTISGKVTAHGETQNCQVVLHNVFRSEIASMTTGKNGKYSFKNVLDGLYFITATTQSDGMGYAVVAVRDGKVYGETDITVYKSDKIKDREEKFYKDIPECHNREDALKHRDRIAEEKRFYDGLSPKEKKQLSKDYVTRLDQLTRWITDCTVETGDGVTLEQGGLVISGSEIEVAENITFTLNVTATQGHEASADGVHNREDQIHHDIHDKSGKHDVLQYYDITLSKEVDGVSTDITSVTKDTEANGKLRVTMEIPEEYRGYKHYTVIHEHCGEVVTLTDLDNDPNTVTFEVDKFSTFVLAATNEDLAGCEHLVVENGVCTECGENVAAAVVTDEAGTALNYYATFAEALDAAVAGNTVALLEDAITADLILAQGVNLDLNGYALTVDSVLTYSSSVIVDSSEEDTGVLKINDAEGNMISNSNSHLPVYDSENGGYRFFQVTVTSHAVTGGNKYWFKVDVDNFDQFNALIQSDSEVTIQVKMTWDGQEEAVSAVADHAFTQSWASRYSTNCNTYVTVTVTENEGVENFTLTPIITANGIEISGEEM